MCAHTHTAVPFMFNVSLNSSLSHVENRYDVDIRVCAIIIIPKCGNLKVTNYITQPCLNFAVTCSLVLQTRWAPDMT